MHIFYCPDIINNVAYLSEEESFHCIKVLRLSKGEIVQLVDGKGNLYEAVIDESSHRKCQLEIKTVITPPDTRKYKLHIAIAPTKNIERFEWFIEKAVEIGVDIITPLICERSERRILKTDRLEKIVISSMKQAIILNKPVINELTSFDYLLNESLKTEYKKFIAHCNNTERLPFHKAIIPYNDILILIGPEGDFTLNEVEKTLINGFIPVSLGNNRLRTETAGIVVCNTISLSHEINDIHKKS